MRTHIMIDDELMTDVLKLTGIKSKREAAEQGLRTIVVGVKNMFLRQLKGLG